LTIMAGHSQTEGPGNDVEAKVTQRWRVLGIGGLILVAVALRLAGGQSTRSTAPIRIDMKHILQGRVNSQGQLVGLHHAPSAPRSLRASGRDCEVRVVWTSPGTDRDVRTARVELRDPESGRVVLEKFSTLYPSAWTPAQIETAIREAHGDARQRGQVERNGRWSGRTRAGLTISGYMSYDGQFIATAYPVLRRSNSRGPSNR
jgi:hypothetical protein